MRANPLLRIVNHGLEASQEQFDVVYSADFTSFASEAFLYGAKELIAAENNRMYIRGECLINNERVEYLCLVEPQKMQEISGFKMSVSISVSEHIPAGNTAFNLMQIENLNNFISKLRMQMSVALMFSVNEQLPPILEGGKVLVVSKST